MKILGRIILLMIGICLLSLGIVLTIHSGAGASPWDAFHLGLSNITGLKIGQISQLVGVVILIFAALLKEYPGWGTILNTFLVGYFIDVLRNYELIPFASTTWQLWVMLFFGILFMGWGSSLYLLAQLGSGPRDSLMLGLIKKLRQPVWKIRLCIESLVLVVAYFLGGLIGIGTALTAILIGFAIQSGFYLARKEASDIHHRVIWDDYKDLKNYLAQSAKKEDVSEKAKL